MIEIGIDNIVDITKNNQDSIFTYNYQGNINEYNKKGNNYINIIKRAFPIHNINNIINTNNNKKN